MDAQYRREHGCQQHLQRHRNPAHKQPYSHAPGYRSAIQVPYHRLRKRIANPALHSGFLVFASAQLFVQPAMHGGCVRQPSSEPFTSHCQNIDARKVEKFPGMWSCSDDLAKLLKLVRCPKGIEYAGWQL